MHSEIGDCCSRLQILEQLHTENKLFARMGGVRQLQRSVFYSLPSLDQDPGFKLAVCGPLTVKEANTQSL